MFHQRTMRKTLTLGSVVMAAAMALGLAAVGAESTDRYDIRSSTSGNWSDAGTWTPARQPRAGDRVLISPGQRVVYDAKSDDVIRSIHVAGTLSFARDRDTLLNVGIVKVQGQGDEDTGEVGVEDVHEHHHAPAGGAAAALEVGTPAEPIPAAHTARIRLHYIEGMNKDNAPAVVCRPGARMDLHGAPMSRTWIDLGANVEPGDTSVALWQAVTGWRVGDAVIVTGSKHVGNRRSFRNEPDRLSTEQRTITKIDGVTVTLDKPLEHEHSGAGQYRSEVANLSRNVIIESADPDGVRGHTMYHRYSKGSISYARFAHLGKEHVLGRYSIHFHRVGDTKRGSSVIGAAIVDSHNRWITIHGTQYLVVRDCVGYQSVGHGFFLEDGTEEYNVLDRNLGVQAYRGRPLPKQVLSFDPNEGAAFWWANGRNTFVRNVSCENDEYGYRYDSQKRSNFDSHLSVRMPDGSQKVVDIRTIPIFRFQGNESHTEGLYSMVFAGTDGVGPDTHHPHMLKDNVIWQTHYALRAQLPTMWVENLKIFHGAYGIYRPWFENHVYKNLYIGYTDTEPFNRGLDDESAQHGVITVDGLTFESRRYGRGMPFIQISDNNLSGHAESHFRNVKVISPDGVSNPRNVKPVVDLGGGPRPTPKTKKGVPVYLHDWYGPGRTAKVVSVKAKDLLNDGNTYRQDPPLTGTESVVAEVTGVQFPKPLQPIDDLAPATIITWPTAGIPVNAHSGKLTVRGTTTDNMKTKRVVVNGVEADNVDFDFHQWQVTLENVKPGQLTITATGEDAAGNVEQTPHVLTVTVR